jgi:hypothetical protein
MLFPMKQNVLLATTVNWPSAARLAGAFAVLGARVEAVAPRGHVLGVSRYPDRVHRYRPLRPLASFAAAIEAAEPDFVIPCDDRALGLLLALPGHELLLRHSIGPLESYEVLMSRSPSIAAAREEGIAAPLTLAVSDSAALTDALVRVGLPCVMKSDASWGGGGVTIVHSKEEAEQAFVELKGPPARLRSLARAVLRKDLHFVAEAIAPHASRVNVQAFIPGKPATSVFAARDGAVLASLHMDVIDWDGATGPAKRMRRVQCPRMEEAARKIAARFGLSGLQGLDFVRDASGVPHLIEINPRATQICHLALGPDLPAALLGAPPRPAATTRSQVALFPQLLVGERGRHAVYEDIPWDDPAVLRAFAGDHALQKAEGLEAIAEFVRPASAPPIFRR